MMIALGTIRDCFEGVIPSVIATLDAQGMPNVSYLSQVHYVDDDHVALSNQFFTKTAANIRVNGRATVLTVSGRTGEQYLLELTFEGSTNEGEVFEQMAAQLRAISTQHGADTVMKLRSADLYRVLDCRAVACPAAAAPPTARAPGGARLAAAARLASAVAAQNDPEAMIDGILDGLARDLGFAHSMILTPDAGGERLSTLASRGYASGGAGSQVTLGEGVIGAAAARLRPVRLSDMSRGDRLAEAAKSSAELDAARIIPLPGLSDPQSQLATPMVSHGRLRGVIFVESDQKFAFTHQDEEALALLGAQLAASLRLAELEAQAARAAPPVPVPPTGTGAAPFRVRYFTVDDSLFIDDAYVIKGVPGRLLFYFLRAFETGGRTEFTNREIRLDASLRLPDLKDNLETRLILLRRRLDERGAPIRLVRPERGRIRLEMQGAPQLEVVAVD